MDAPSSGLKREKRVTEAKPRRGTSAPFALFKLGKRGHQDDDEEDGKTALKKAKTANASVMTLDVYDPYEYREELQMGHLSNCMAWAHLVKCSFGTGVLTMPKGFAHAGMIPALILGVAVGGFCLWCMHILIKSCVHIAAREREPYIPFNETMKYTFTHGYPACQPISKCIKVFTDLVIVGYHFGICIAYVNYLAQTILHVIGYGDRVEGYNGYVAASTFVWVPFLIAISMIRNLKWLAPVSMVGNVLTFISMAIILYYVFSPNPDTGKYLDGEWHLVGKASSVPLYIGIILFAVEAFGVIIAVERDMKHPRKFLGLFGVFNNALVLVLAWYLFLGIIGYLKFGVHVKSTISLTLPEHEPASLTMKCMLGLALFCSYPLHLFVCIDTIWTRRILPKFKDPDHGKVKYEMLFRCGVVITSALLAFAVPQLDLLVSLIGAVCLSFLGIMMPAIMEYNVAWSKYGNQWSWTMAKDVVIVIFGLLAFAVGTYGSLYGLFSGEDEK